MKRISSKSVRALCCVISIGWACLMTVVNAHADAAGSTPLYVDSKAVKDRFSTITAEDMDLLRSKKILFGSRSFGGNTLGGLKRLAQQDKKYDLLSSFKEFDVSRKNDDLSIIPADVFSQANFVHFTVSGWPLDKRVDQIDELLRKDPHDFGKSVDVVIMYCEDYLPQAFDHYSKTMDALRADYPKITFIYACSGFHDARFAPRNEQAEAFSEKVREAYMGKVPLFDTGKIVSDDFRVGHLLCPEYTSDSTGQHPNLAAGELMLAKGFLLVLRDALRAPAAK